MVEETVLLANPATVDATRYASVLGLGFGDCGKGRFVDALSRHWKAHTVVRFNGGAQAGHNVVTCAAPGSPSLHHTFAQFGSGTLVPGTWTALADPMVVHPTALLVEASVLGNLGVFDALSRLAIDAGCRITTPYHQSAGRLREHRRGQAAHGTCGVGVGETVRHDLAHPDQTLRYGECRPVDARSTRALRDKLQALRRTLLAEFEKTGIDSGGGSSSEAELQTLRDESVADRWLPAVQALARQCPPASTEALRDRLTRPGWVLFEGAQGILLDEWRGFHPHTTWSSTGTQAVEQVMRRFGIEAPCEHLGVLRCYPTRHGPGPFPTQDRYLNALLPEPHNPTNGWQGAFRRGHPDAVLIRYALEAVGRLSGLLVGHLDVLQQGIELKWCDAYQVLDGKIGRISMDRLPLGPPQDLNHQKQLTRWLEAAEPRYAEDPVRAPEEYLERIAALTSLPIVLRSYGATS